MVLGASDVCPILAPLVSIHFAIYYRASAGYDVRERPEAVFQRLCCAKSFQTWRVLCFLGPISILAFATFVLAVALWGQVFLVFEKHRGLNFSQKKSLGLVLSMHTTHCRPDILIGIFFEL
jgi:hypothetical protein